MAFSSTKLSYSITLRSADGKEAQGEILCRRFSTGERGIRAFARALIIFFITAILIAIPILHFFLVPLGLVMTVTTLVMVYRTSEVIEEGNGLCPACGKPVVIFKRALKPAFTDLCEGCHRELTISVNS